MMCTEETQGNPRVADNENMIRIARATTLLVLASGLFLWPGRHGTRLQAGERFELPDDAVPPASIQFPRQPIGGGTRLVTAGELNVWGRSRNLVLVDDCGLGGLKDGLAEVIPSTGLDMVLSAPGPGRLFLYLDLVSFRPLPGFRPHLTPLCDTGRDQLVIPDHGRVQLQKPLWLEVIVNGHVLKTLYQGGGTYIQSPVRVTIDRVIPQRGRLEVRLLPSPGDSFFAVWDVLVSDSPDLEPDGPGASDDDAMP